MRNDRDTHQYIWRLQETLNRELGLQLPLDGVMSARTRRAIRKFQRQNGLTPDGIVRLATERALLARNDDNELAADELSSSPDREIQQSGQSLTNTRAQYQDLLIKIRSQLERRFRSPNDPMLLQRRQELRRLFTLVPPVFANELFRQLQNRTDLLGSLLTSRLAPATRTELLRLLQNKIGVVPALTGGPMLTAGVGSAPGPTKGADLPLILAGPIVRRATTNKVWFWFACSKEVKACQPRIIPYNQRGEIWTHLADPTFKEIIIDISLSDFHVVRLGENIWIVLVSAVPKSRKFPADITLGYDLNVATEEKGKLQWTKLSELELNIKYPPFPLPTFVIGELNRKLVHGSCRRPGANGDDAFLIYDKWLSKNALDAFQRPASLILTGDQIYADDLAAPLLNNSKSFQYPLFEAVRRIARAVFGYVEHMPNPKGEGFSPVDRYSAGTTPGNQIQWPFHWSDRQRLTHRISSPIGFTTEDGEAHLLSFPEYAAMHLAVWNPRLCRDYKVDNGEVMNLRGFWNAVEACRRVMANTATYMLFDDHEITDDWNLDKQWRDTTQANPLARRIIANGLAAYWSFQAWGNAPEMFDKNFVRVLSSHFEQLRTSKGLPSSTKAAQYEETLREKHWSFIAESNPKALCIDTRTSRDFVEGHAILSGKKVQEQLSKLPLADNFRKGEIILLVTPTPFLPHNAMMMGQAFQYPFPEKRYQGDWEFYANYPPQQAQLLDWLTKLEPSAVVFFSGDVHHGSVVSGRFAHGTTEDKIKFGAAEWVIRIVQITSSPIKNRDDAKFINPKWDGKVGGINVRPLIDVSNPLIGRLSRITVGDIGKVVAPRDHVKSFSVSGGSRLLQSRVRDLEGDLASDTFIFENHLCVVDMPARPKADVKVLFVGVKDGKLAIARASVDTDNDPSKLKFTVDGTSAVRAGVRAWAGLPALDLVPPPN
jgi:hypothetical protein